jgi:hypothetical protein
MKPLELTAKIGIEKTPELERLLDLLEEVKELLGKLTMNVSSRTTQRPSSPEA